MDKEKDIAGVYAMEAKIKKDQWHRLVVTYDSHNGDIHFMVDDLYETKHHMQWANQTHDTATEIRVGM